MEDFVNNEVKNKVNFFVRLVDFFKSGLYVKKFLQKNVSKGTVLIVLACIFLLNVTIYTLGNSFNLNLDLTKNKAFTLSNVSSDFVKKVDKDVEIIVLNDEADFSQADRYFKQANCVLKQYAQQSNRIRINYVDVVKNPAYLSGQVYSGEKLTTNSIIVKSGEKYRVISVNDLFDIAYGYYGAQEIVASKAEQELTSAILYVTSENQKKIAFLKGYDEADSEAFCELLKKNNFNVVDVNLLTEEIPSDAAYAVIFAPSRDYDVTGINKINNYLKEKGCNLFYAVNPELKNADNLVNFIKKWGINIKDGLVYETDTSRMTSSRQVFEAVGENVNSDYTSKLKECKIPVLMPVCRPLECLDAENVKVLLQYSSKSGIMPDGVSKSFDMKAHICGPNPVALIAEKHVENIKNTVMVLGSFVGLTENYLMATSINNSSYFVNLFNSITKKEDPGIVIEPKNIENEELGITGAQANIIGLFTVVFLPLTVVAFGLFVYFRRRRL